MKDNPHEHYTAIDLGSNSFHMVVARNVLGQLRVIDRLRETVRLADGLDGKGGLSEEARQRALDCLSRFGQRIRDLPPHRVRAIATNTVRALRDPQSFLSSAESALGHGIEVVSGSHNRDDYFRLAHLAMQFGLLASAGSDYHGPEQPWIELGRLPE